MRGLVLFCAGHNAAAWREVWTEWRYSEMIQFALVLKEDKIQISDAIADLDCKYAEQYSVALLMMILKRLR